MEFKKIALCVGMSAVMALGMVGTCFAAGNTANTDVKISVGATTYDFSCTEAITGTVESGSSEIENLTQYEISNESAIGCISASITAAGYGDWTLVSDTTNFASMAKDSKKFSLKTTGTGATDFSGGTSHTVSSSIAPAGSSTVDFTGHTGLSTTELTETKVGTVTTTVAWV